MKNYVELKEFKLDKNSPVALHLQLVNELLKQLRALSPSEDYVLPSERTMVKHFGINRLTVHRAYDNLLKNGLVMRMPDKSLCVAKTARRQLQGIFPTVGILLPEKFSLFISRPIPREYLKGMIDRATELGVSTMMLTPPGADSTPETADRFIEEHCSKLSGIIHLGSRGFSNDTVLDKILNYTGIPQIFVSGFSEKQHIGSICADIIPGAIELCAEMKKKGVKTIGLICRPVTSSPSFIYNFSYRLEQMKGIFEKHGFEITMTDEFATAEQICINCKNLPDMLWCINDDYARSVLKILKENNIRVPEDVKVAGFDGISNNFEDKTISSIGQKFYRTGYDAIDLILEHFKFGITRDNRIRKIETFFINGDTL